jgi:hypothetical protein
MNQLVAFRVTKITNTTGCANRLHPGQGLILPESCTTKMTAQMLYYQKCDPIVQHLSLPDSERKITFLVLIWCGGGIIDKESSDCFYENHFQNHYTVASY